MDDERTLLEADARVRAALMTDGAASRRVVMRALAEDHRPSVWMRRVPYAVAAAAAVVMLLVISARPWRRTVAVPPVAPSLTITGAGSLLVVDSQDGRRWLVGPPPERRTGHNYVIVIPR
jgi:hypothetical protein